MQRFLLSHPAPAWGIVGPPRPGALKLCGDVPAADLELSSRMSNLLFAGVVLCCGCGQA